jgi:Ca-activated chloride channel family protein
MEGRPIWIWAAIAALVGFVLLRVAGGAWQGAGPIPGSRPGGGAVAISIASSSSKQEWLHQAVEAFNEATKRDRALQVDGRPVQVEILQEVIEGKKVDYRSGTMVTDTLSGKIKPTVLSPGDESWIVQFRREWQVAHGTPIAREDAPILVRSPMVLAMWQSRAKALGCWPAAGSECTWQRIRDVAAHPGGWELVGRPEWRRLKIGYSYFGEGNSGTLGVVAMCMRGAGKTQGLTLADVEAGNGCGELIGAVEKAKVHSGNSSSWLLEKMATSGPEYLDAAFTWEVEVIGLNQKFAKDLREPIVAVYPQDGTMLVGHPFAILDGAPWATPEQVAAAKVFGRFLLGREQQERVLATGLRPVDAAVKLGPPIAPANGANPDTRVVVLEVPEAAVIERVGEVWHVVKKHAAVALVLDKSGSMSSGGKMRAAIKGAQEFVGRMDGEDRLLWMPFDTKVYAGVEGRKADVGERLLDDIAGLTAGGGTALYDAVLLAHQRLGEVRQTHEDAYRYGIVVLSDGKDENSRQRLTALEAALRPSEGDPTGIQIHTIAIGADADEQVLKRMAQAAHGRYWKGGSDNDLVGIYGAIAKHY